MAADSKTSLPKEPEIWIRTQESGRTTAKPKVVAGLLVAISTSGMPTIRAEHNRHSDTSTAIALYVRVPLSFPQRRLGFAMADCWVGRVTGEKALDTSRHRAYLSFVGTIRRMSV